MIKVKDNYKNQYADQTCRGCGRLNETQQHILTNCKQIHEQDNTKVGLNKIFQGTTKEIKSTANKIIRIIEKKKNGKNNRGGKKKRKKKSIAHGKSPRSSGPVIQDICTK